LTPMHDNTKDQQGEKVTVAGQVVDPVFTDEQ
jgi:hypothetical protein